MRSTMFFAALSLAASAFVPAAAHDFRVGDLAVGHPYSVETPPGAPTGAGYLSIRNEGTSADRLLEIRADLPRVEIHTTDVDTAGVARMRQVEAVDIPAGETVTFAPRGLHVMFMGLTAPLVAGEVIDATLVFETAGEVEVQFNVETRKPGAEDHSGH